MKTIASTILMMLVLQPVIAQSPVPLSEEPRHHFKFENQYVRVYDVKVQAGDTTLYHTHSNDYLYVTIGKAALRAQVLGSEAVDLFLKDGETRYTSGPITHRVTNVTTGLFRNITIEVLKTVGSNAWDPVSIPGHTPVFENDKVRVERLVIDPGQSIPLHTHSHSGLGVAVSAADIVIQSPPSQKPQKVHFKPGDFQWHDGPQTHSLENVGKTRFEAVHIDWK